MSESNNEKANAVTNTWDRPVACEDCSDDVGGTRAIETKQCNCCECVDKASGWWNATRSNQQINGDCGRNDVERPVLNRFLIVRP